MRIYGINLKKLSTKISYKGDIKATRKLFLLHLNDFYELDSIEPKY